MSQDSAPVRHAPTRWQVVIVALFIAATWAFGATLPLGSDLSYPPAVLDFAYYVRVVTASILLATFALVAWLVARLARSHESIRVTAWLMASGGITAALGNLLEDGMGIADASVFYGLGLLFGVLGGLISLTIALAWGRQALLAGLTLLTLVGLISGLGRGLPLMPVVWFAVAAWVAIRGVPLSLMRSGSSGLTLAESPAP